MKHFYIARNTYAKLRFTEQNTGGMELCTGFIIFEFYDMYEVSNRCVFKLVLYTFHMYLCF